MKRHLNLILLVLVVVLVVLPLTLVKTPRQGPAGQKVELFSGSDDQGTDMITRVDPAYKRWMEPLMVPPSPEIECLLFGLQASIGAGFIGFYLGSASARAKARKTQAA